MAAVADEGFRLNCGTRPHTLSLLPSGPDEVRERPIHRTRTLRRPLRGLHAMSRDLGSKGHRVEAATPARRGEFPPLALRRRPSRVTYAFPSGRAGAIWKDPKIRSG